jgi:hypothetical protein
MNFITKALLLIITLLTLNTNIFGKTEMKIKKLPSHPRLMLTEDRINTLKTYLQDDKNFQKNFEGFHKQCEKIMQEPISTRKLDGDKRKRMLRTSRDVLRKIMYLGTYDKVQPTPNYQQRIIAEMLSAADFIDWHESHFLDTAEMTAALALGYDWYYDVLTKEQKDKISNAIRSKGLKKSYECNQFWVQRDNNWNQVCHCGMVLGALATFEDDPTLSNQMIERAKENIHTGLESYAPDGIYKEGTGYWGYGTSFTVLMTACLDSALDEDWNVLDYEGIKESFDFVFQTGILPSKKTFGFADTGENPQVLPQHMWLGNKLSNNVYCEMSEYTREYLGTYPRMYPLSIIYYIPSSGNEMKLPLTWHGNGEVELSIARTSWSTSAIFTAIKAGNIEGINHGHMDIGSFVIDMLGEQWATDLGSDMALYDSTSDGVWSTSQNASRWKFFRVNSLSHNTLNIGGQLQRVAGINPITRTTEDIENMSTTVDMSNAYEGQAEQIIRQIAILDKSYIEIKDSYIKIAKDQDLTWNMATKAKIELNNNKTKATLSIGKKKIFVEIVSPVEAAFSIVSAKPKTAKENQNNGYLMLQAIIQAPVKDGTLKIIFKEK